MISEPDYSYVGSGHILVREYGSAAPFLSVGNCSALSFSPQSTSIQLTDFTSPGGGQRNRVDRVTGVDYSFTVHDLHGENLARFLRGTSTAVVAGTATAEQLVAYKGGWTPFGKYAATITSVKGVGGTPTYVAGTDYELDNGGIFIPSTSTIANPVSGAANCQVDYTFAAHTLTEALVSSAKQYTLIFVGLNEARSGSPVRVTAHKISGGVLANMGLLGEDYASGEVSGALLSDTSKGAGLSKYFSVLMVA